jgi:hypothetical protein
VSTTTKPNVTKSSLSRYGQKQSTVEKEKVIEIKLSLD